MYSTCLFCKAKLGSNDAIEHFPIGRRLAFDAGKGRLWVICGRCTRWNLTPLEERWEAVEECERLFRGTRIRASTENIGLARLPSGLDLVRIGRPQLPEIAAWRYGDRFRARYRRSSLVGGGIAAYGAASWVGGSTFAAVTAGPVGVLLVAALYAPFFLDARRVVMHVTTRDGEPSLVRGTHADEAKLIPSEEAPGWRLVVPHASGVAQLVGRSDLQGVAPVFAHHNAWGAPRTRVRGALGELERVDHPAEYPAAAAAMLRDRAIARAVEGERYAIKYLPTEAKLALEMAVSEEAERHAIEGELRALEDAWREAEEIAAIADSLLVPPSVERFLATRGKGASPADPPS